MDDNNNNITAAPGSENLLPGGMLNPLDSEIRDFDLPRSSPPQKSYQSPQYRGSLLDPEKGTPGTRALVADMKELWQNPESFAHQPLGKAKNWSYDAEFSGANFERYYRLPRVYKEVGFSPWRDNESEFNQRTTWFEDWKRSAVGMANIAVPAFTSMLPWNAYDGDVLDREGTKQMERWQSIGASGKTGAGGFFNNLTLNAGFTVGILSEFALEEGIMWGISALAAPESGGLSLGAAGARFSTHVATAIKRLGTIGKMGSIMGKS